jgi:hypothetical protein
MSTDVRLRPREVASSIEELLADATHRRRFRHEDGKSGAPMEHVIIDGEPYVVKYLHPDDDWIMRAYGDLRCAAVRAFCSGLMDAMPPCIDPAVVGAAAGLGRHGWGAALLMRDVSAWLVPEGDDVVDAHHGFIEDMAALHAHFWGFSDRIGLTPYEHRWVVFSDEMCALEPHGVPRIAADGWRRFAERAPADVHSMVADLRRDRTPLVRALRATPSTFVHGDWKMGNLGRTPDGRTILLDWQSPGEGPACSDLAWYLALNRARLPESKQDAIASYRRTLQARGVDTEGWWDVQLDLALLGLVVIFGWEKALGPDDELGWWCDRVREGAARL